MFSLSAQIRKVSEKKAKESRKEGRVPAILYGPKIENLALEVDLKEFNKAYREAGESSLIELNAGKEKFTVLIYNVQFDALSGKPIHVDFLQPSLEEEIETNVPLVFEGESKAVSDLEGTLVRNLAEIEVRSLPQKLPREIKVSIDGLETFEDEILVKDLEVPEGVKVLRGPNEIVATVSLPEKIEEELEKPIEEKVEEVERVEEEKEPVEEKEEKKEKEETQ
jgi:large subunit ribosomal protein L25